MSSEDNRLDLLDKTLGRVIDWLKFAEAKNGALVAVGCAVLFGAFRVVSSLEIVSNYLEIYIVLYSLLIAASVVISLMSFIPRLEPPFWIRIGKKSNNDNPLFFGHACKYSKVSYLEIFDDYYGPSVEVAQKMETAICDQIVNNSKIAFIKYRMFNSAVFLFLAGILTPIGALLIYWMRK